MTNRILLYVHFNKENELADYVPYQLEKLGPIFDRVFFVSNSVLSEKDLRSLQEAKLIDDFLQRNNEGYDFKAWSDAMHEIGFDQLADYDSVTLMNDTCFGPVFDFKPVFEKMDEDESIDFWGLTNNRSHEITVDWQPDAPMILPDHIQSYFVNYKQKIVKSVAFKDFWKEIPIFDDVLQVIVECETKMTQYFEEAGFQSGVVFDTRQVEWKPHEMFTHDFSVFSLPQILERGIPFLKIKAFLHGAENVFTPLVLEKISRQHAYPANFIIEHMSFVDAPDRDYMLRYKTLDLAEATAEVTSSKVGIHLHVFYVDLLDEFVKNFDKYIQNYDLYITTNSEEKKNEILSYFEGKAQLKEVLVTGNLGRDVLPWKQIHDRLDNYEIAGHFHTKKSAASDWIIGETWRHDLIDFLVKPAQDIFKIFEENPKVGLFIPDVPDFFTFHHGPAFYNEAALRPKMDYIWKKLGYEEENFAWRMRYVMSYGTMIWYRPQALKNILDLDFLEKIPEEPLPLNSVLHAFERMLVYVAWLNGYDFRISQGHKINGFLSVSTANRMVAEAKTDPAFRHMMFDMRDETNYIPLREIAILLLRKTKRRFRSLFNQIKKK